MIKKRALIAMINPIKVKGTAHKANDVHTWAGHTLGPRLCEHKTVQNEVPFRCVEIKRIHCATDAAEEVVLLLTTSTVSLLLHYGRESGNKRARGVFSYLTPLINGSVVALGDKVKSIHGTGTA
jgi:hypothetical protein